MHAIAYLLLMTPAGVPETAPPEPTFHQVRDHVRHLAIDWQILDDREQNHFLARPEDWGDDLNTLRKRVAEFADVPRVEDIDRFPPKEVLKEAVRFNRALRRNLEKRLEEEPHHAALLLDVIDETDRLYKLYDALVDARCNFYYSSVRRCGLRRARELLGPDAYARAELPLCVPMSAFTELSR